MFQQKKIKTSKHVFEVVRLKHLSDLTVTFNKLKLFSSSSNPKTNLINMFLGFALSLFIARQVGVRENFQYVLLNAN